MAILIMGKCAISKIKYYIISQQSRFVNRSFESFSKNAKKCGKALNLATNFIVAVCEFLLPLRPQQTPHRSFP